MIPSSNAFLKQDFEIETQPSRTYKMHLNADRVQGFTDNLDAMKQAIYNILSTQRYQYIMYSGNYGVELNDLYGQPLSYVLPELERRITEALTWDERIDSVSDFEFDTSKKGTVHVKFTVHTVFGDIETKREVSI